MAPPLRWTLLDQRQMPLAEHTRALYMCSNPNDYGLRMCIGIPRLEHACMRGVAFIIFRLSGRLATNGVTLKIEGFSDSFCLTPFLRPCTPCNGKH